MDEVHYQRKDGLKHPDYAMLMNQQPETVTISGRPKSGPIAIFRKAELSAGWLWCLGFFRR
jgi:hypothetical protein